jgi:hypothetical protein
MTHAVAHVGMDKIQPGDLSVFQSGFLAPDNTQYDSKQRGCCCNR